MNGDKRASLKTKLKNKYAINNLSKEGLKYAYCRSHNGRGQNATVKFRYNTIPYVGLLFDESQGELSLTLPVK